MARSASVKVSFGISKEVRDGVLNHTRRRIVLEGAWQVFARDGLEGATMRAIAEAAGCTTGAIYPLFASKEAIYAELLLESLDRLLQAVADAIQRARGPRAKLKAGAFAFVAYYRDKPDEVALGLYLWHGLKPRGLTPELDTALNARLDDTLDLLRDALRALGHLTPARAQLETGALFAFLIGALVVHQTGRLRMVGSEIDAIAALHLEALVGRLESHGKRGNP